MRLLTIGAVAAMGLTLGACTPGTEQQTMGTIVGATAGGLVGSTIGSGRGRTLATAAGIVAGGLIGSHIGAQLDEQNRRRAMEAEYRALQYGPPDAPVVWRDPDRNVYGEVVPGRPYQRTGYDCRDYTHTIYVDGRPQVARGTACLRPDGTWATV
jgi:surface antigen